MWNAYEITVWKQKKLKLSCCQGLKVLDSTENNLRKRFYNFRKKFWISSCYQNFQVRFLGESSRSCKHLLLRKNRLWPIDQIFDHENDFSGLWKMFLSGKFAKDVYGSCHFVFWNAAHDVLDPACTNLLKWLKNVGSILLHRCEIVYSNAWYHTLRTVAQCFLQPSLRTY